MSPASDPDLAATEQGEWDGGPEDPDGELIVVEGESGWDAGWWFPGPGDEGTVNPPGTWPGGGGGGPGPAGDAEPYDPGRIPKGEDCSELESYEECRACCDRNRERVWEPYCRRKQSSACWRHIQTYTYPSCIGACELQKLKDPVILTRQAGP